MIVLNQLIEEAEDNFLVAQHWWVPTLADYLTNVPVDMSGLQKYLPNDLSTNMLLLVPSYSRKKSMMNCLRDTVTSILDIFSDGGIHVELLMS